MAQRGKNILSAVKIIIMTHLCILIAVLSFVVTNHIVSPIAVLIFWGGAFLFWYGVRDHIENSILLRMVYMVLSCKSINPNKLFSLYESQYGVEPRLKKLERSGFIKYKNEDVQILDKGHRVVKMLSVVTRFWRL
jgi:hypothetical protein